MITIGIIGSSGYVAGELIRCLLQHPNVKIDFLYSHSQAGEAIGKVHQDLANVALKYTDTINSEIDVLFLCLGHGNSKKFLEKHSFSLTTKIIDLSNDFRLEKDAVFQNKKFVYGLIEAQKEIIQKADCIANPGCFATAIQLALLPLAEAKHLKEEVHVHALTGSTGAGQSLTETSHFSWRNQNISIYKAFQHQHLGEIHETLKSLQNDWQTPLNFLPLRGDFTRGIFASVYMKTDLDEAALLQLYKTYYKEAPFVFVTDAVVHLKQVVNTNNAFLQIQKVEGKVLITSVIDNLLKGAAGQAIQNMNLLFGFPETMGLQFKANYF
ncbi:N-acetyl-gamma-glutamyl-phosphate reductase [Aequorivita sp. Q41]|uniref:N-acetyl-gamma-glutamyl-phosphate reductase n=1 Tax=Aequorivita sp. Q41 TaxID=3153300 RepID=UPI0032422F6B